MKAGTRFKTGVAISAAGHVAVLILGDFTARVWDSTPRGEE